MADPIYYYPKLTDVGAAAAFNAADNGLELTIDSVTFGAGVYDPDGTETSVQIPLATVEIPGGTRVNPTQIRLVTVWDDPDAAASINEVGYWSGSVLVYIWSRSAGGPLGIKTQGVDFVLFHDLTFTQVPANSINVEVNPDLNQALAALMSHEGASNAHPQYLLRSGFLNAHSLMTAVVVTGSTNDISLTLPAETLVTQYQAGQQFVFVANGTNTGAVTVNVNGLGAKAVTKNGVTPLSAGDVIHGSVYTLFYDGLRMQLSAGVSGGGSIVSYPYVAEVGQTDFAANYLVGNLFVFVNGRLLSPSDYTATNGSTVILHTPSAAEDAVVIFAFKSFSVPDAYRKEEVDNLLATLTVPVARVSDATAVGRKLMQVPSSGTPYYIRVNPDNTLTLQNPAAVRLDIGAHDASNITIGALSASRLQFYPVQQGGGIGQAGNKVYLGWGGSGLKATVDALDLGNIAFESFASNASNLTSGTVNPARLPTSSETGAGTVANATLDEVNAGVVDTKYVSPYKLRFGFSISLGSTGHIKFPSWMNGLELRWGTLNVGNNGNTSTGNIFTTACHTCIGSLSMTGGDYQAPKFVPSGRGLTAYNSTNASVTVRYWAIGN